MNLLSVNPSIDLRDEARGERFAICCRWHGNQYRGSSDLNSPRSGRGYDRWAKDHPNDAKKMGGITARKVESARITSFDLSQCGRVT
jgi:hypothetical protein